MVLNENFLGTGLAVPQNRSAIAAGKKKLRLFTNAAKRNFHLSSNW